MAGVTVRHGIAVSKKCAEAVRRFRTSLEKKLGRRVSLSEAIEVAVTGAGKRR